MPAIRPWQSFLPNMPYCLLVSGPFWVIQSKPNHHSELALVPGRRKVSGCSSEQQPGFPLYLPFCPSFTCRPPPGVDDKHMTLCMCVHTHIQLCSLTGLLLHPNITESYYYLTLDLFSNICTHFIRIVEYHI